MKVNQPKKSDADPFFPQGHWASESFEGKVRGHPSFWIPGMACGTALTSQAASRKSCSAVPVGAGYLCFPWFCRGSLDGEFLKVVDQQEPTTVVGCHYCKKTSMIHLYVVLCSFEGHVLGQLNVDFMLIMHGLLQSYPGPAQYR